jgi:hypothetical protein
MYRQQWKDFEDWKEKYGPVSNHEAYENFSMIGGYFNSIGMLVENQILDIEIPYEEAAGTIISTWERIEPITKEFRKDDPSAWMFFEYLYNEIKKIKEQKEKTKGTIIRFSS